LKPAILDGQRLNRQMSWKRSRTNYEADRISQIINPMEFNRDDQ
jgi:hypothetical protein